MVDQVRFPPSIGGSGKTYTNDANPETGMFNGGHRINFFPILSDTVAAAGYVNQYAQAIDGAKANADRAEDARGYVEAVADAYNVNLLEQFKRKATLGFDFIEGRYWKDNGERFETTDFTQVGTIQSTTDVYLEGADGNLRSFAIGEVGRGFKSGVKKGKWSGETRTNTAPFSNDPSNWTLSSGAVLESSSVTNGVARARVRLPGGTEGAINFNVISSDGTWTVSARIKVLEGWDDGTLCTSVSGDVDNFRIVYAPPKRGTWGWVERVSEVVGGSGDVRIIRRLNNAAPDIVLEVEAQQIEKADNRSPYIPVDTATPVTRNSSSDTINLGDGFNSRRGTIYIEAKDVKPSSSSDFGDVFSLNDGTSNNRIRLHRRMSGRYSVNLSTLGVDQFDFHQHPGGDDIRFIVSWDDRGNAFACINGVVFTSAQNIAAPVGMYQKSSLGSPIGQTNEHQWYYSPVPITQAEAIALTAGDE